MNIYENAATQAIVLIFKSDALWKKEILFNFLLEPFGVSCEEIVDVTCQDSLKETIPDFTVKTNNKDYRYEVKIGDVPLTKSEKDSKNRDAFLIPKNYRYKNDIPSGVKIRTWEDLFALIDYKGAKNEFDKLALTRDYLTNNSEDTYFKKDIDYLRDKIINHESLRAFYRETFNKFFNYAKANDAKIEVRDDRFYSDTAIYSMLVNKNTKEYITIEYPYNSYEDDMNFYCHHYRPQSGNKGRARLDDWIDLKIDFSASENLFDRVEYLIENVLPQYQEKLGNDFNQFFKTEKCVLKVLYSDMRSAFDSNYMSSKLGDKLIEERLRPVVQKIACAKKLKFHFDLSSEQWSGFYFYKDDWKFYRIGFEFAEKAYRDFFYGIQIPGGENSKIKETLRNKLKELRILGTRKLNDAWWARSGNAEAEGKFRHWNIETFQLLFNDSDKFRTFIEEILEKFLVALSENNLL